MSELIHSLRESLFRNTGLPYRNLIGLVLGYTASTLLLSGGVMTTRGAALAFVVTLAVTMLLLVVVRPYNEDKLDKFAWGLLVIVTLGFGVGALMFHYRDWWKWLWHQYLRIKHPHDLILESLFLLGVILGVFVVRNWAKDQEAFMKSLSGILGGTFIAAVLGEVLKDQNVGPKKAFAFYALGFTISATINLIVAAVLTASYTNRRSIISRSVLDFLYGSERAEVIDNYFLKNFEKDKNYAKRSLTDSLLEFETLVSREFAKSMELRRKSRDPSHRYYQLLAIESDEDKDDKKPEPREYSVLYRKIATVDEEGHRSQPVKEDGAVALIDEKMFRVGIAAVWQDTLEYITTPGSSRQPFKYARSVAGLALTFRKTIVMHRDRHKRFRNPEFGEGITPDDVEQNRGLDAIDYLSYLAMPIVARASEPSENALGIMTIDTKLFITQTPSELAGIPATEVGKGVFRARLTRAQLNDFGCNLYEQNDKAVRYIEELTKVITPVMELYAKCRIGSI